MPPFPPPDATVPSANLLTVAVGTELWRVHSAARAATEFNTKPADVFHGGRFDSTLEDPFPYLYGAYEPETAVLESLVRSVPFSDRGQRWVRRVSVAGRRVSPMRVARDLRLVRLLDHADLAAVCQDEWLVQADPHDYPLTRYWGTWLRRQVPAADGFTWPSRRNLGRPVVILFGDRGLPPVSPAAGPPVNLDDHGGAAWFNTRMASYRIRLAPPARPASPAVAPAAP